MKIINSPTSLHIQLNTNAGGLATFFALQPTSQLRTFAENLFIQAVTKEYEIARSYLVPRGYTSKSDSLRTFVIVDDNVKGQLLYQEMRYFCDILGRIGISGYVADPEDLRIDENGKLIIQTEV